MTGRRLVLLGVAAAALAAPAAAAERWKVSPMVLQGEWFGTLGALPPACAGADGVNRFDGFWVVMQATDTAVSMSVQPSKEGRVTGDTINDYKVVAPPEGAPLRLELFLSGKTGDAAVDVLNGSSFEWVPAGADKGYGQSTLFFRRCSGVAFPR